MDKQSEKIKSIKRLQTLRNIGPKMAEKLYTLGIKSPEQMRKSDPEELFRRLQAIDNNVDPCELLTGAQNRLHYSCIYLWRKNY